VVHQLQLEWLNVFRTVLTEWTFWTQFVFQCAATILYKGWSLLFSYLTDVHDVIYCCLTANHNNDNNNCMSDHITDQMTLSFQVLDWPGWQTNTGKVWTRGEREEQRELVSLFMPWIFSFNATIARDPLVCTAVVIFLLMTFFKCKKAFYFLLMLQA